MPFAETACKPLELTDDVQQHHTGRAAQHTRRRQRRTVLPQAAPHRRQKRCKLHDRIRVAFPAGHLAFRMSEKAGRVVDDVRVVALLMLRCVILTFDS